MNMDLDTVTLSEEEDLLEPPARTQPTNSDLMKFLEKMNVNLASNNLFKATATKRMDQLDTKVNDNSDRIARLESHIVEMKSNSGQSFNDGWSEQRKLQNNVNIVGIHPSTGENLINMVLDVFIFYGLSIAATDVESVYRVKYAKSNMIIVKFVNFETKLKLLNAKKNKKLTVGDILSVTDALNDATKEIFINTHVTPFVGRLLHRGRLAVKGRKLAACWMSANSILVKVTDDGAPIMIKSMPDFDKILGESDLQVSEPSALAGGKRRIVDVSPTLPTELQPKSKPRTNMRGRNGTGPLSTKINKERAPSKAKST